MVAVYRFLSSSQRRLTISHGMSFKHLSHTKQTNKNISKKLRSDRHFRFVLVSVPDTVQGICEETPRVSETRFT